MIQIKSAREIAIMREAGRIVAECHAALAREIGPGISTRELDHFVEEEIRRRGATPTFKGHQGFPGSICVAVNDVVCHGIPGAYRLREGDIVTVDIGATYQGYHGDSAVTYAVGPIAPEAERLMRVTRECLEIGIAAASPGNRLGDIGHAIQRHAEAHGLGVVREFTGHGIGRELWEAPSVPHYGEPGTGALLRPGMTLAIEPMITLGDWRTRVDADGWTARTVDGSLCAQYEHTVLIADDGPVILTRL